MLKSYRAHPLISEFTVKRLREEGHEAIQANNGKALEWCKQKVADVLVTDISFPERFDGWQIAERFREHDPSLPMIYATGFSPVAARPVPAIVSLQKTYHPEEIVQAVRQVTRAQPASGGKYT